MRRIGSIVAAAIAILAIASLFALGDHADRTGAANQEDGNVVTIASGFGGEDELTLHKVTDPGEATCYILESEDKEDGLVDFDVKAMKCLPE